LAFLQLLRGQEYRQDMDRWRILPARQLPTVRGSILDRNGNVLAVDRPVFWLHINYRLSKYADERYRQAAILTLIDKGETPQAAERMYDRENADQLKAFETAVIKCAEVMGCSTDEVRQRIAEINDRIWERREFYAWFDHCPDSPLRNQYRYVPQSKAREEFARVFSVNKRLRLAYASDKAEMYEPQPLFELDESQLARAHVAFLGIEAVTIEPEAKRVYPFGSAACQIVGWVGPVQEADQRFFQDDKYRRYLDNEVCGASGVERVCEALLRGSRGEVTYDKNDNEIARRPVEFGKNVRLSIDIHLQQQIEQFLSDPNQHSCGDKCLAAVVQEVATGDILAMVSTPVYDLNTVRRRYDELAADAVRRPFLNKALTEHYPPGSTIKPILLAIALQEGKLSAGEVISCPSQAAPEGWPNCLFFRKTGLGHDWRPWPNNARNAIRVSCNVFFSHAADRMDPAVLQRRLFDFGYGHRILPGPFAPPGEEAAGIDSGLNRFMPESTGYISSRIPSGAVRSVEDLPPLNRPDLKQFGIGQGNLTVTVLQVANAAAVIAREGIYKHPRLFLDDADVSNNWQKDLGLSPAALQVVREGMRAAVTEEHGTGYEAFSHSTLNQTDVKVFGKTGSTSGRYNAWFMCFAEDSSGRALSLAVVVEGGRSGSEDAAPLARRIMEMCHEAGYIGRKR
jgi:penicillin-binding protein 2